MSTEMMTITPKELAAELGTDPKTVRRMLRRICEETPGKGGRWSIPVESLDALKAKFNETRSGRSVTAKLKVDEGDAAEGDEADGDDE